MRLLESIHDLDVQTFSWCLRRKNRELAVLLSRGVSYTANGPFYVLAGLSFMLAEHWSLVKLLAIGFVLERTLYFIFKNAFKRNRPPEAIPGYISVIKPSDKFSFPSGHTSAAFLVAVAVSWAFPFMAWILFPWAISVGIARVMLGVHFPTDTLAGAALGSSLCLLLISALPGAHLFGLH
ncbi:MAG TPA: phosphatase PAP2 family protein [Marinagarivorans sp.]